MEKMNSKVTAVYPHHSVSEEDHTDNKMNDLRTTTESAATSPFSSNKNSFTHLFDHKLNILYQFYDRQLQQDFQRFLEEDRFVLSQEHNILSLSPSSTSSLFFGSILITLTVIVFPWMLIQLAFDSDHNGPTAIILSAILVMICFLAIFTGWKIQFRSLKLPTLLTSMISFIFGKNTILPVPQDLEQSDRQFVKTFLSRGYESVYITMNEYCHICDYTFATCLQCMVLLALFRRALRLDCSHGDNQDHIDHRSLSADPDDIAMHCSFINNYFISMFGIILQILPCLLFITLPQLRIDFILSELFTSCAIFVGIVIYIQDMYSLVVGVIICIVMTCLVLDSQWMNINRFLTYTKVHELYQENERVAAQNQSNELRCMIGNVAHDLKTPLASFVTGVDCIQDAVNEMLTYLSGEHAHPLAMRAIDSMQSCITNIRNTNSFMLMTINRCIDYTKASKGLKLFPHYETVDLVHALELPFSCMQNIQSRIALSCSPFPVDLCTHVITDKQWLQENLLCLLSNAVKYSSGGTVSVSVSLEERLTETIHYGSVKCCRVKKDNDADEEVEDDRQPDSLPDVSTNSRDRKSIILQSFHVMNESNISRHEALQTFIRFEVEDTGIGMSEEAMASLFNPFKQTQRLAGGTGLGLYSLAKRLEALKGFYGVEKRRDGKQGSLFWFAIPYKADKVTSALIAARRSSDASVPTIDESTVVSTNDMPFAGIFCATSSRSERKNSDGPVVSTKNIEFGSIERHIRLPTGAIEDTTASQSSLSTRVSPYFQSGPLSILVVDDSPPILKMTTLMLKRLGHRTKTAENGAVALELMNESESSGFDVILMDLQMPVMDGLEATKRIRGSEKHTKQIVIGMSANSDHETTVHAFEAGVDTFMAKPFTVETFKATIEMLFQKRETASSLN